MRILFALLLAAAPARAADAEGARDNFDAIVRGYVGARAENGFWSLNRAGGGVKLKLRYAEAERSTVSPLGGDRWRGLADFTDAPGKKRWYADVTVSMGGGAWSVTSLKWKTAAEARSLRSSLLAARPPERTDGPPAATVRKAAAAAPLERKSDPAPAAPSPELLRTIAAVNYDPSRDAKADIAAAVAEARRTKKRVLLEVGSAGCSWCSRMHRFVAEDPDLAELREKNFVTVRADMAANAPLWRDSYGRVPGTPHFFVLGDDGDVIRSQDTSELEQGSTYDRDKFRAFLAEWGPPGG